jgi:uncharacterized protein YciI
MQKMMKHLLVAVLCMGCILFAQAQNGDAAKNIKPVKRPEDQIEQYFFVMIKTGPKQDFDSTIKAGLLKGHMANINKLYYDGILKVAGPFGKNELSWRGIFVFDCKTKEEAAIIAQSDPAIAAGLFAVDIVPWYSAPIGSFAHGKPTKPQ